MPKTFLDFTNTGYLSSANFIGYQGNQEFSINFKTLAAAVNNYIEDKKAELPMIYRYQPSSSVVISDNSKSYGMYLSGSVLELDIKLGAEWITLTKAGSGYNISTNSLIISTDRAIIYPNQAVNIKNTALSSYNTIYFVQTGSSILTIFGDVLDEISGIERPLNIIEIISDNIEAERRARKASQRAHKIQKKANDILEMMKDLAQEVRDKIDERFPELTSGHYDNDATQEEKDACERYRDTINRIFNLGVEKNIERAETADPAEALRLAEVFMRNSKGVENQLDNNLGGEDPCGVPQPELSILIDFSEFQDKLKDLGNAIDEDNRINEEYEEVL